MRILFIHQNFPAQFKYLAPTLAKQHQVRILTLNARLADNWQGIPVNHYALQKASTKGIHPWIIDFEAQVIRGEATLYAAFNLRQQGFTPDVIIAHPGWGESLALKDVWSDAKLGLYCEFFYRAEGADVFAIASYLPGGIFFSFVLSVLIFLSSYAYLLFSFFSLFFI